MISRLIVDRYYSVGNEILFFENDNNNIKSISCFGNEMKMLWKLWQIMILTSSLITILVLIWLWKTVSTVMASILVRWKLNLLCVCRKIPRDLTEASLSGAGLSIVAALAMMLLFGMVRRSLRSCDIFCFCLFLFWFSFIAVVYILRFLGFWSDIFSLLMTWIWCFSGTELLFNSLDLNCCCSWQKHWWGFFAYWF